MVFKYALIAIAELLGAFGQVFMKIGMGGRPPIPGGETLIVRIIAFGVWLVQTVFTRNVFIGLMLYFISSLFWLTLLRWFELSFVYPLIATGYIVVMVLSYFFFHDQITWVRIVGVLLICAGVGFIAQTAPK